MRSLDAVRKDMAAYDRLPRPIRDFCKERHVIAPTVEIDAAFRMIVKEMSYSEAARLTIETLLKKGYVK